MLKITNVDMKNEVILAQVWTLVVVVSLLLSAYKIWRFGKKHPEIFERDTTADNKSKLVQKAELRRQYHNKSLLSFSVVFIWMIGIVAIFSRYGTSQMYWPVVGVAGFVLFLLLRPKQ